MINLDADQLLLLSKIARTIIKITIAKLALMDFLSQHNVINNTLIYHNVIIIARLTITHVWLVEIIPLKELQPIIVITLKLLLFPIV